MTTGTGLAAPATGGATRQMSLDQSFASPPDGARPWVYWFWINGNISKVGITLDLEAMQRVGIGGALIMDVGDNGTPAGNYPFASDLWQDCLLHAFTEASRLGLEINLYNAAGWAGSGGPWNTVENSMQKIVWSETSVSGGARIDQPLAQPAAFRNYYHDIAVLAFPTPADDSYRIANINYKAGFSSAGGVPGRGGIEILPIDFPVLPDSQVIPLDKLVNLSSNVRNGRLAWDAPPGNWTILRFGHTSTGRDNHPASKAGKGLECDKLSKSASKFHFQQFIGKTLDALGPVLAKTMVSTHIDSWEVGAQNWTPGFREQFQGRAGYDLLNYLPTLQGRVVGSLDRSERFLWDLRKIISDMIVENYAGGLKEAAHERGIRLSIEAIDGDPTDEIAYGGMADEPFTEFWWYRDFSASTQRYYDWTSNMASAAHVYGRNILSAEAFTALPGENWQGHPALLKEQGDWAFTAGINRFIFHRYAMQPWADRKPGMTMGAWGQHYERTQTWWEESRDWHTYLTRCQHMLRQGLFVADLLYLQPEGAAQRFVPPDVDFGSARLPDIPGYNLDGCNADVILNRVSIGNGMIRLPDGMSYRMLVLPEQGAMANMAGAGPMTPALLRKIAALVNQGMTLVGPRPPRSPSLADYPACDQEIETLADALWGKGNSNVVDRRVGKGRVVYGMAPAEILQAAGVPIDFSSGPHKPFRYVHRRMADGTEIYFVANKQKKTVEAMCSFRAGGARPELWWPESGKIEQPAIYDQGKGCVHLPLLLGHTESVFVIFRPKARIEAGRVVSVSRNGALLQAPGGYLRVARNEAGSCRALVGSAGSYVLRTAGGEVLSARVGSIAAPLTVSGGWEVRFAPGWGAPPQATFPSLTSWSAHADEGIKYFSGHATYVKTVRIPASMVGDGKRLYLDLGEVAVIVSSLKVNGKEHGILWRAPFVADITDAATAGVNQLDITVVNLWPNRLIGDQRLPEDASWGANDVGGWASGGLEPGAAASGGDPGIKLSSGVVPGKANGSPNQSIAAWPQWLLDDMPSPTGRYTFTAWKLWSGDQQPLRSGLLGPVTLSCKQETIFKTRTGSEQD